MCQGLVRVGVGGGEVRPVGVLERVSRELLRDDGVATVGCDPGAESLPEGAVDDVLGGAERLALGRESVSLVRIMLLVDDPGEV